MNAQVSATDFDLVVVGAGVAGALAAHIAARAGLRTAIIAPSGGATQVSSGAVDVADAHADDVPGPHADPFDRGPAVLEAARALVRESPDHPYAMMAGDPPAPAWRLLPGAIDALATLAHDVELTKRSDGYNHVLVSEVGLPRRAFAAPASMVTDADLALDGDVMIIDIEELPGFDASHAAHMFKWAASLARKSVGLRSVRLALGGRSAVDAFDFARRLDDPAQAMQLAERIATLIAVGTKPKAIWLPAVLGTHSSTTWRDIEKRVGVPVRELLATSPSVPGLRLSRALDAGVVAARAERIVDKVERIDLAVGATNTAHTVWMSAGRTLRARACVIAAGRFFAGGVVRDGTASVPVLQHAAASVVSDGTAVADRFIGDILGAHLADDHAIFRAGVSVDHALRPLVRGGLPVAERLWCAGTIAGGFDVTRGGAALGVSALMGWRAAHAAIAALR